MATIQPYPRFKALLDDGTPAVGYKVYSYAVGTTSPKATYADQSGATPNANPVILDGSGEAPIFLASGGYKLVLTDLNDVVVWTQDGLNVADDISVATLTVSGSTALGATSVASLTCASTVKVANLNADKLDSGDWAEPGSIGATTPAAITGTVIIANTSMRIGAGGTAFTKINRYDPSYSPAAVNANTTAEQTFALPGVTINDVIVINKPTAQAGLGIVGVRASAADTIAITFSNNTGSPITPTASEAYKVIVFQS